MMIKISEIVSDEKYLVVGCFEETVNDKIVIKRRNYSSIDAKAKKIYLFLGRQNDLDLHLLNEALNHILQDFAKLDLQFLASSFATLQISELMTIQLICENIYYAKHNLVSYRNDQKIEVENTHYTIVTPLGIDDSFLMECKIKMECVNLARNLQDTPPNIMTATYFANEITRLAAKCPEIKVTVLNKEAIKACKMNLLLAVNKASVEEPRVVSLEYRPSASKEVLALVGKGITFDTGGYSLKPWDGMKGMKFDMSGAAIACASVIGAAKMHLNTNLVAIAVLTDNMIGGHGTMPETVVKSMNGLTVEITDIDAEGRLVLADGLTYAIRNLKATKIIDLATLTGAAVRALDKWYTCVMSTDDKLYNEFEQIAMFSGEPIWRMPINIHHKLAIKEETIADLKNALKDTTADMSIAAAFIDEFRENKPFLHLDIAGTADDTDRGKGVMVKTLLKFIEGQKN